MTYRTVLDRPVALPTIGGHNPLSPKPYRQGNNHKNLNLESQSHVTTPGTE